MQFFAVLINTSTLPDNLMFTVNEIHISAPPAQKPPLSDLSSGMHWPSGVP